MKFACYHPRSQDLVHICTRIRTQNVAGTLCIHFGQTMKRVAIIEDNPDNRLLICAMLEESFEIIEFESGHQALASIEAEHPDLVLLDISLPGMDGLEVLNRLRQIEAFKRLPIIAVTAHAMAGDRERFLAHGFDDYLSKPILDDQMLIDLLASWLDKAS